jgi:hypothetical protein
VTAVLDPSGLTGIETGYFAWSTEDDRAYLVSPAGAIPIDGARVLTTLDDDQLSRMGSDWFLGYGDGRICIQQPASPAEVGDNGFEGEIAGYWFAAAATAGLAGAAAMPGFALPPNLDFTASEVLDSRITASGGANGMRFNAAGQNVSATTPRFDYAYNSVSGLWEPAGLLVEEARTNLCLRSNEIDNASWNKGLMTVTADQLVTAYGVSLDLVDTATESSGTFPSQTITVLASTTYAIAFDVKQGTAPAVRIRVSLASGSGNVYFNLTTKTFSGSAGGVVGVGYKQLPGGVLRIYATVAFGASDAGSRVFSIVPSAGSGGTPQGTFYLGRVAIEAGAFSTSYIATTSASVPRTADSLTISGANFSSWWNAAGGTFVASADSVAVGSHVFFSAHDGTANNRIRAYLVAGPSCRADMQTAGVSQATLVLGAVAANTPFEVAYAFALDNVAGSLNGAAAVADASATLPVVDRMTLGADITGTPLNGHLRSLRYIPRRATNAELLALAA